MVSFNSLSEGEKFAFSKDFLIRFRVIQKLRPELTEEKDILSVVAKKFYDENITNLEECIKFIDSKAELSSLSTVNLEPAVKDYEESLKKKIKDNQEKLEKTKKEEEQKILEYKQKTTKRNFFDTEYKNEEARQKSNKRTKNLIIAGLIVAGLLLLPALGGGVGVVNALLAFVADLSALQVITIGLVVWLVFKKGWIKNIKEKIDEKKKARNDKNSKILKNIKEKQTECQKEQQAIADERAKLYQEITDAQKTQDKTVHQFEAEKVHIGRFERMNKFDTALKMCEVEIKSQYEKAIRQYDSEEEKKNLGKWHEHFVGALYYGAYSGKLKSRRELDELVKYSGQKFEQLSNPLNINRSFSDENARAQRDFGVNKPIEEMYESI